MRLTKAFGLALLAAVTAMALIGTSSASAGDTALCEPTTIGVHPDPCPAGKLVKSVHFEDKTAILLTDIIVAITCESLVSAEVKAGDPLLANPLVLLGLITYTNCNNGCEAQEVSPHIILRVLREGHELARVTGEGEVLLSCGLALHCVYNAQSLVGHGLGPLLGGGLTGVVTYNNATVNKVSGLLCPSTSRLHAEYVSLKHLYIAS